MNGKDYFLWRNSHGARYTADDKLGTPKDCCWMGRDEFNSMMSSVRQYGGAYGILPKSIPSSTMALMNPQDLDWLKNERDSLRTEISWLRDDMFNEIRKNNEYRTNLLKKDVDVFRQELRNEFSDIFQKNNEERDKVRDEKIDELRNAIQPQPKLAPALPEEEKPKSSPLDRGVLPEPVPEKEEGVTPMPVEVEKPVAPKDVKTLDCPDGTCTVPQTRTIYYRPRR